MKLVSVIALMILIASCGGGSGSSNKAGDSVVEREALEGEQEVSMEDAIKEIETNFSNELKNIYVNQSFTVDSNQLQLIKNPQSAELTECRANINEKHTVVSVDETSVRIYVEKKGNVTKGCEMFFERGKFLEIYEKSQLLELSLETSSAKNLKIYRGFRNGILYFSLSADIDEQGITGKVSALLNPNVSTLYASEIFKMNASFS